MEPEGHPTKDNGPYFREILAKKNNLEDNLKAINDKRLSDHQIANQNLEDLYHQTIRTIISLYRSSDDALNAALFREAADGLVKMQKLVRKKLNEAYSMSFQEGIYSFLIEFIETLPQDLLLHENSFINSQSLNALLSQPGDPEFIRRTNSAKKVYVKSARKSLTTSYKVNQSVSDNLKRSMGATSSDDEDDESCNLSKKRFRIFNPNSQISSEDEEENSSSDTSGDNSLSHLSPQIFQNQQRTS